MLHIISMCWQSPTLSVCTRPCFSRSVFHPFTILAMPHHKHVLVWRGYLSHVMLFVHSVETATGDEATGYRTDQWPQSILLSLGDWVTAFPSFKFVWHVPRFRQPHNNPCMGDPISSNGKRKLTCQGLNLSCQKGHWSFKFRNSDLYSKVWHFLTDYDFFLPGWRRHIFPSNISMYRYHVQPNRSTVRECKGCGVHLKISMIKPNIRYIQHVQHTGIYIHDICMYMVTGIMWTCVYKWQFLHSLNTVLACSIYKYCFANDLFQCHITCIRWCFNEWTWEPLNKVTTTDHWIVQMYLHFTFSELSMSICNWWETSATRLAWRFTFSWWASREWSWRMIQQIADIHILCLVDIVSLYINDIFK